MATIYLYGFHTVEAYLQKFPKNINVLWVLKDRHDQRVQSLVHTAEQVPITIRTASREQLDELSADGLHQGVVIECKELLSYSEKDLPTLLEGLAEPAFLLILDGVQDPHNLGACLRSANAAGVHAVIAPKDRAASITPTVRKVACGAAEMTPFIQVTNLARTLRFLQEQGIWLYGMAAEAEKTVFETKINGAVGLVLGSEGYGLRQLTQKHCDDLFKIPMYGTVSSLNVSVATAVGLFEVVRQRLST